MAISIRAKIDSELTKKIGKWFTVREIQDKLKLNPSTLKPLIMKYARENVLKRRSVKGTARSVQFTPAAANATKFQSMLINMMPYRNPGNRNSARKTATSSRKSSRRSR